MRIRAVVTVLCSAISAVLCACSSTVSGAGAGHSHTASSTPVSSTSGPGFVVPSNPSSVTSSSSSAAPPLHPVPSAPLRTANASGVDGKTYVLKIWAEVVSPTCHDHAYGQPMINFLTVHPCRGLTRDLMTTTVNGRGVGLATSTTSFPGTAPDLYKVAGDFRKLVTANGTGNFNDLLRDGYRLPSGPTAVPSPDAFSALGQDSGVIVYDMWYLAGPTPENDPALVALAQDIFLQF